MPNKSVHITCTGCGQWKLHCSRQLCRACYNRANPKKTRPLVTCIKCGLTDQPHHGRGLCKKCYLAEPDRVAYAVKARHERYLNNAEEIKALHKAKRAEARTKRPPKLPKPKVVYVCTGCGKSGKRRLCDRCYKRKPENIERVRQKSRERYQINKDRYRTYEIARGADPERRTKRNAVNRRRYKKDPAKILARVLAYQKANPGGVSVRSSRHRALRNGVPGSHTRQEWLNRLDEFDNRCGYCLAKLDKPTQDHMTPVSWGELSSNYISNIIPACIPCNAAKCDRNMLTFLLNNRPR